MVAFWLDIVSTGKSRQEGTWAQHFRKLQTVPPALASVSGDVGMGAVQATPRNRFLLGLTSGRDL